jgi:hypothetical protein
MLTRTLEVIERGDPKSDPKELWEDPTGEHKGIFDKVKRNKSKLRGTILMRVFLNTIGQTSEPSKSFLEAE